MKDWHNLISEMLRKNHIIFVGVTVMDEFKILANEYLSKNTVAFYNVPYTRMGNPGNPDFLNQLKNTFNDFSQQKLQSAVRELQDVLESDFPKIVQILELDGMTICVVPRAKSEENFRPNQQLFRATVQATIGRMNGIVDGSKYLLRHTNTRTTHLRSQVPNYNNDGPLPYPRITKDTCEISPSVRN